MCVKTLNPWAHCTFDNVTSASTLESRQSKNILSDLKNVYYDVLVFFSPSGIESLFKNFPDFEQKNTRIAVFGKNTAKAATDAGLNINIEAPLPKVRSMSEALDIYIAKTNKAKS